MTEKRTLLVVGGGIGGYTAAIRAARAGLAVTLVEDGPLGGTCLNVGCIPSKSLLGSAAAHADRVGRSAGRADLAPIMARKTAAVARLVGGVQTLIRRNRIDHVAERAELLGPGRLRLAGSGRILTADAVILATGSRPARPAIPGLDLPGVLDSDAAIALDTVPERLLVLGGGVIGMELAQVFADLGARVAVVEKADRILPGEDAGAVAVLAAAMRR
ncbi:dihydrolipoyl dehydrogenase, partial [Prosthecomicrobium hirschii]|uniref:FAD-dependent oxidoreductase n=1 Tax=Prosthecodimorpha hirschii TaxID=665126 RepID=UPI00112B1718